VLAALMEWGDRWSAPAGIELRHRGCGSPVHTELRCAKGHRTEVGDIDLALRKDARPPRT
jgi:hypothetical protein